MEHEFKLLFEKSHTSGCDKRAVIAGTWVQVTNPEIDDVMDEFVTSANYCVHEGDKCPRIGLPPGAGYDLCQAQHAEQNLVKMLREEGRSPSTDILWVAGHYYACETCAKMSREFGFKEIRVREFPDKTYQPAELNMIAER